MIRFVLPGYGERQFHAFVRDLVPHNIAHEFVHLRDVEQIMGLDAPTVYLLEGWRRNPSRLIDEIGLRRAETFGMEGIIHVLSHEALRHYLDICNLTHRQDLITVPLPQEMTCGAPLEEVRMAYIQLSVRSSPSTVPTLHHPDPVIQGILDREWNRRDIERVSQMEMGHFNNVLIVASEDQFRGPERNCVWFDEPATSTTPHPDEERFSLRHLEAMRDWMRANSRSHGGISSTPTPIPPVSHKVLLSILGEMGSAICALWDTDEEGRITNPCPVCGKPAYQCDEHVPVPNDLRIKPKATKIPRGAGVKGRRKKNAERAVSPGIEWTDGSGMYHRLEDQYLEECGLCRVLDSSPRADPSMQHQGGGCWRGKKFIIKKGATSKTLGAILMSKPLPNRIDDSGFRDAFLERCRALDEAAQGGVQRPAPRSGDRFRPAVDLSQQFAGWTWMRLSEEGRRFIFAHDTTV